MYFCGLISLYLLYLYMICYKSTVLEIQKSTVEPICISTYSIVHMHKDTQYSLY